MDQQTSFSRSATKMQRTVWEQWDHQTNDRQIAYIELNNLYLLVERGTKELNIWTSNQLRVLATKAYGYGDPMIDWWGEEFIKLPNWNNV